MKIVTLTNDGYSEMSWNMLVSLARCGIPQEEVIVYCLDQSSAKLFAGRGYETRILGDGTNSKFQPWSIGVGAEEYSKLTHTKCDLMVDMLRRWKDNNDPTKQDTLFIDGDIVVLQDPRALIHLLAKPYDIDGVFQDSAPDPNRHCTGFFFCKGRNKNRDFWKFLKEECRQYPQHNDQIVFKILLDKMRENPTAYCSGYEPIRPDFRLLPQNLFPDGKQYFENLALYANRPPFIVHNNWIVGNDAKKKRFQEVGMWYV